MQIFVGNLAFTATEAEVRQVFEGYGTVETVRLMTDRDTGRPRGFGFVEMPDAIQARAAIAGLNGSTLGGRMLTINEARPRDERGGLGVVPSGTRQAAPTAETQGAWPDKERQRMTETHKQRDLVATLRDALRALEGTLGHTREGVDEIASQAERLRERVEALCAIQQREDTAVGIDMFVDAATAFLEAFRALESGILDVQAEVDTLEAEMADDEDGRDA
jgi:hypothetical protein